MGAGVPHAQHSADAPSLRQVAHGADERIWEAIAIHTANGIDEGMYVKIGGIDQWIQIRGQDRKNPVLLCLHGPSI